MGRVMTEEEYDEWKKEREGGKQGEQNTGIDWGMGEIKLSDLKLKISNQCCSQNGIQGSYGQPLLGKCI